ncbi:MAG: hypothetical protein L0Y58_02105 [Verrucomicrobia subdivision 3 bacterium]|nr:hypothetical protein [Limisphaerales bacterium]
MKTATVRDLRNNFSRVSRWIAKGETVQIVKRGRPFARVVPEPKHSSFLGCMAGSGTLPDDLDEPVPVRWEAAE